MVLFIKIKLMEPGLEDSKEVGLLFKYSKDSC